MVKLTFRKAVFASVAAAAVAYALLLLWFLLNEDALLFHPERGKPAPPEPALDLRSKDVTLTSSDGVTLVARVVPPPPTPQAAAAPWVLYFHGASGNIGTPGYNRAWARFRRLGFGLLAVDYRGYGASAGVPSETGFYRDAEAAYHYLKQELRVPAERIVIYGYSLGSAVAIDLAAHVQAAGLIVEGALTSVPARAVELYPYVPAPWLARNRFASIDKIASVDMPKLFIHAREDQYVPLAHGQRLFERAVEPKFFQSVAGSHTSAYEVDPQFFSAIERFVSRLRLL